MKKILLISQCIPQWYADLLSSALINIGELEIVTGSNIKGNIICKTPVYKSDKILSKLISWFKYFIYVNNWMKKNKKINYDLVICVSNPPINSYIGLKLKNVFNSKFIYMNWDLYPQIISSTFKSRFLKLICNIWEKWNITYFPKIDKILTIGNVMGESICKNNREMINVDIIPVSVNVNKLKPIDKKENIFVKNNKLENKFIVLYSGKMGIGHNIEIILESANILSSNEQIEFVFIGGGAKYNMIENYIYKNKSSNILLLPWQTENTFPLSIACGDIGIVSQEVNISHLFMPSKTYSMMACGEAIIGICTEYDDLCRTIKKCKCGETVTDGNPITLANIILRLSYDKNTLNKYKEASRMSAETFYSDEVIKEKYIKLFNEILCINK